MVFNNKNLFLTLVVLAISTTACFDDLNIVPIDEDFNTSEIIYRDEASYKQVLAKLYSGLALTGQKGPAGDGDLKGFDEGFSSYLRQYWVSQELTTDEAVNAWVNDIGLEDFHQMDWDANNGFVSGMYNRIYFQIPLCNEFIRETTDEKLAFREIPSAAQDEIRIYREEARFLRALSYWHALDLFQNVPFITEENGVGAFFPNQTNAAALFNYIETELIDVATKLPAPRQNEYGRADQAAAWMLLAKLYLNAETYIGTPKYTETITYTKKIIEAGYSLQANYEHLFLADNHNSTETIFPITFHGQNTQTWGGMTYLVHAAIGGDMSPADYGVNNGWWGNRTTKALVEKFDTNSTDARMLFVKDGQSYEISNIGTFIQGWGIAKFKNITSTGAVGSHNEHPDTDFPMFRLADAYLMYAEAVLRGGSGGDAATALGYVNDIRSRSNAGTIAAGDLTLDFILDERARELYWEGHRRTDLIRYNKFTTNAYLWPWKGNASEGQAVDNKFNVFPIPASDLGANPNLTQNSGY
jgi:starch-binding outer membrane protein, SusD/RagB family